MLHEIDTLDKLHHPRPVVIGPSTKEGLCPATHYPNHYKESGAFINKHIPTILESAAKAVIDKVGSAPTDSNIICNVWQECVASSIVQNIGSSIKNQPDLDSKLTELILLKGGKADFIKALSLSLRFSDPETTLTGQDIKHPQVWVPRFWQPIISENGIMEVIPEVMIMQFEQVHSLHTNLKNPLSAECVEAVVLLASPEFSRKFKDYNAKVTCLGKAVSTRILLASAFNYALKVSGVNGYISSIDERGFAKSNEKIRQEYIALAS